LRAVAVPSVRLAHVLHAQPPGGFSCAPREDSRYRRARLTRRRATRKAFRHRGTSGEQTQERACLLCSSEARPLMAPPSCSIMDSRESSLLAASVCGTATWGAACASEAAVPADAADADSRVTSPRQPQRSVRAAGSHCAPAVEDACCTAAASRAAGVTTGTRRTPAGAAFRPRLAAPPIAAASAWAHHVRAVWQPAGSYR
jgi:hypothetical protein